MKNNSACETASCFEYIVTEVGTKETLSVFWSFYSIGLSAESGILNFAVKESFCLVLFFH